MPTLEYPMSYAEFLAMMNEAGAELYSLDDETARETWALDFCGVVTVVGVWCPLSQSADLPTV